MAYSLEALDGGLSSEGIVGVEVEEDELEGEAHEETVTQEVGLVGPERWHGDLVLLQNAEIRHFFVFYGS